MADSDINGLDTASAPAFDDEAVLQKVGGGSTQKTTLGTTLQWGEVDSRPSFGGIVGWYGKISGTTETEIFKGGVSLDRVGVAADSMLTFNIQINTVMNLPTQASASFIFQGTIQNIGGTTTFAAGPLKTIVHRTHTTLNASIEADDTNDALIVKVTASDSNFHYCSAQAFISEIR